MSRSFLVDSLILKKTANEPVRGFSPPRSPYSSTASPATHSDVQRAAADHALHSLARHPGHSSVLDVCCPWCVHGSGPTAVAGMLPVSLPTTGPVPLVKPIPSTSSPSSTTVASTLGLSPAHPIFSIPHRPPLGTLTTPSAFSSSESQNHHPLRAMDPRRIRYMNLGE